jgi:voltage-gated potassium channel
MANRSGETTAGRTRTRVRDSAFWQAYSEQRYTVLFYTLLAMLVALPMASWIGLPANGLRILLGACLLAAVMPNSTKKTRVALAVSVVVLLIVRYASESDEVPIPAGLMVAAVGFAGLLAAASTLRFVVTEREVGNETIYAALSTYLLAGLFFAQIYLGLERLWPGSLTSPTPFTDATAVYYSFVTLATLGYGDILPKSDLARGVAVFEVIGGQLFLAVMVARLIGLFGSRRSDL